MAEGKLTKNIIYFGTPEFSVPSLDGILRAGLQVPLVVTQSDKPKGRGHVMAMPPVKEFAISHGIRVIQPLRLKDENFIDTLKSINPDFIVVVAYGRILPKAILDIPKVAPINLHASLLPKLRGASPIAWAIINGETKTGVTTMVMSEGLDEGDILLREEVEITDDDTAKTLGIRLSVVGSGLLVRTLEGLINGSVKKTPQIGTPSYAPPLKKQDGRIDWRRSAREIFLFIRGMEPWPGAYTRIGNETVKILKAKPLDGTGTEGRIETVTGDSITIGTAKGLLSVIEVKPQGKRAMSVKEFLQGRRLKGGELLI
ncbi:MAG: methionyl-tRNA formyltransferase [Nitrospirae bacterium]|nr:methionyl-tRNA formyltransferase [Nitrospirota bacterium]